MPQKTYCCNPLKKEKHKSVSQNLVKVGYSWNYKFKNLIGKFICLSCKAFINYRLKESVQFDGDIVKSFDQKKVDYSEMQTDNDNLRLDPSFVCTKVDDDLRKRKLNTFLIDNDQPPIKKSLSKLSKAEKQKFQGSIDKITSGFLRKPNSSSIVNNSINESWITNLKEELKKTTRNEKNISSNQNPLLDIN